MFEKPIGIVPRRSLDQEGQLTRFRDSSGAMADLRQIRPRTGARVRLPRQIEYVGDSCVA